MRHIEFTKMQGIGNDFIVIDDRDENLSLTPDQVRHMCDRKFGIGADGIMLVRDAVSPENDFSWWFANNDGTIPDMCGNGSRCFARFVYENGLIPHVKKSLKLETLAGVKEIGINVASDKTTFESATVNMGKASAEPATVPTTLVANSNGRVIDVRYNVDGREVLLTAVSMGNPHAVLFTHDLGEPLSEELVATLGPKIERSVAFPAKTNVEFIEVVDTSTLRMRVWERGVGETLACGTGASAAAYAAHLKNLVGPVVTVKLLGGDLHIEIKDDATIFMTGNAENVFTGIFDANME